MGLDVKPVSQGHDQGASRAEAEVSHRLTGFLGEGLTTWCDPIDFLESQICAR